MHIYGSDGNSRSWNQSLTICLTHDTSVNAAKNSVEPSPKAMSILQMKINDADLFGFSLAVASRSTNCSSADPF